MAIEILKNIGRLDDAEAITRFLATVPNGEGLRTRLVPGRRDQLEQYDAASQTARYLTIDGAGFVCFVVTGVSLDAARSIARRCRTITAWSTEAFHAAVEAALNLRITPVTPAPPGED